MLALLAFLPFGLLFAALTVVIKQGSVGTSWVIALLSIVGGLYFPVALLPAWVRTAAKVQPFTSATSELRHLLVNSPLWNLQAPRCCAWPCSPRSSCRPATYLLSRAIRLGQRRGTIIEY